MKNFIRIFVVTALFTCIKSFGTVVHAPNLDNLETYLEELNEDALVVFDVDFTLLVPNDHLLGPNGEEHYALVVQKMRALQSEGEILGSQILQQSKVSLVDPKVLLLLERLKQKRIKAIALTAMPTGQFGLISNLEEWRVEQLASHGIDFTGSFPDIDSCQLEAFEGQRSFPVFKGGVLVSNKYPKGQVLVEFLKKMQYKPSEIVFVDDRMEYIDSIEKELEKEKIKHTSFYYTAAKDRMLPFNQSLANFQIDYLFSQGVWLSDEEAQLLLNTNLRKELIRSQ